MATAEERLAQLGLTVPPPPSAVASYFPWSRVGPMVLTSGQLPWRDGRTPDFVGRIGADLTLEQGYEACRLGTLNAIAQLKDATGDLERIRQVVRLEGVLNVSAGFTQMPKVLNGASDLLAAVFEDRNRHSRMIYSNPELPLNCACLIVLWAEVA